MIILSLPFQKDVKIPVQYKGWKEYRLDYNPNPESFDESLIDNETIVTIRDKKEGGIYSYPIPKKIDLYIKYINRANCMVDLELENHDFTNQIPTQNLILSWHCFSDNWTSDLVEKKIHEALPYKPRFIKIALNTSDYSQFNLISNIINKIDYPIIFVGMGLLGKQSRILYNHLNSKATYVGLDKNHTASGQLNLDESEQYNLAYLNSDSKIGGLIGGQQVYHSLGLKFYNDYFKQHNLNAVYLPLPVEDLSDFMKWQKTVKTKIFGFSITMPFKTEIASLVNSDEQNINLHLPTKKSSYNSDKIALQKSLDYLQVGTDDKILVYGSGATAEMAMQVLQQYNHVYLKGRNIMCIYALSQKYGKDFITKDTKFNLIINCTPIGMKGENFLQLTELEPSPKFIDLPYSPVETPLIEFCRKRELEFVDGKMFWQWQATKQLEEFIKVLKS